MASSDYSTVRFWYDQEELDKYCDKEGLPRQKVVHYPFSRGTDGAAGYDLHCQVGFTFKPGQRRLIQTGLVTSGLEGHFMQINDRSSVAYKLGLVKMAGIIDVDYRGCIGVVLLNTSDKEVTVCGGDRIAQLIFIPYSTPIAIEVKSREDLGDTTRGAGGFGSTGK